MRLTGPLVTGPKPNSYKMYRVNSIHFITIGLGSFSSVLFKSNNSCFIYDTNKGVLGTILPKK